MINNYTQIKSVILAVAMVTFLLSACGNKLESKEAPDHNIENTELNQSETPSNENEHNLQPNAGHDSNPDSASQLENGTSEPVKEVPVETIQKTRLAAVGDIIVYSSMMTDARTGTGFDFTYMFSDIKPFFEDADFIFANQETMVGGAELGLSDYPRFNSPVEIADAVKDLGVDIVSVANNHTLDRGFEAVEKGLNYWNQLEVPYTGAYLSEEDAKQIRTVESNGIRFAILAYTYGTNGLPSPKDKLWVVNRLDEEKIIQDIAEAKKLADVIIISYHFGDEYVRLPNDSQKKWVNLASKHGAHIVLGHHPHVLQPVQWIEQEDGHRTFVAYSLGNFLAAQDGLYKDLGGIVKLDIEKKTVISEEKETTTITLKDPTFILSWIHKKNWRDYKIRPLHDVSEEELPGARKIESELVEHMRTWMPELNMPYSDPQGKTHSTAAASN